MRYKIGIGYINNSFYWSIAAHRWGGEFNLERYWRLVKYYEI